MTNSSRKLKGMINSKRLAKIAMALTATTAMAGYGVAYADASNNTVTVTDGETVDNVYGGIVTYEGYDFSLDKVGGTSESGDANSNNVGISGGKIEGDIYGGSSTNGNAENNNVEVNGEIIDNIKKIVGGHSKGYVINNTVVFTKDAVINSQCIIGGYNERGAVSGNIVSMDGGTVDADLGIFGGAGVTVKDNVVNINGGIIKADVVGGAGYYISNNTVNINGGRIEGDIIGSDCAEYKMYNRSDGIQIYKPITEIVNVDYCSAKNNIININGNPNLTNSRLYGSTADRVQNLDIYGNNLNIYTKDLTAKNIYDFDNINFYIPVTATNGSTMLTLTEGTTDLRGTTINSGVMGGSSLTDGDSVTLLTNTADGLVLDDQPKFGKLSEGVSLEYELTIEKIDDHSIVATVGNKEQSNASNNTVTLTAQNYEVNGTTTDYDGEANNVYGGRVSSFSEQDKDIVGGTSKSGNAVNNTVNIEGAKVNAIIGADLLDVGDEAGFACNNVVNISDGTIADFIYAARGAAEASDNVVNMIGGTVRDLHGGQVQNTNGSAKGNTIIVSDGNINNFIVAGEGYGGAGASSNRIDIKSGKISGGVWAGWASQSYSDYSLKSVGDVVNNVVNIYGGTFSGTDEKSWGPSMAVCGGLSGGGNAVGNKVNIRGGLLQDVFGGVSMTSADGGLCGNATENSVMVEAGEMRNIYGGYSEKASVSGNIITIKGGTIKGVILGGLVERALGEAVQANDNTINIYEVPDLRLAYLCGGTSGGSTIDTVANTAGNTLNVYTKDIVARNISGFENINFYIPATATNGSTMLTLTAGTTDLRGAKINAGVMGGSSLSDGDTVTLITNTADGLLLDDRPTFGKLSEGVSLDYDLTISKLGKDSVIATIGNVPYSPEPKPESGKNSDGTLKFDTPSLSLAGGSSRSYSDNVVNIDHDNSNYDVNGERVTYDEAAVYILETSGAEDVLNNEVNVSSGTFTQKVWGAASDSGTVRNNKFSVTGGTYTAGLLGACSNYGDITENSLSLSNVDITGDATGAWSNSGDVTVNTFVIDSGRLQGDVTSARSESGNVSGNTLNINGGHITGDVFGGWSTTGQAYNNTININGGIIDCFIVGGVTADGNSTGNVMNISGSPDLTDAYLVGSAATGTYDTIPVSSGYTGHDNTLNIRTTGLSVQNIAEFDTLNFYLPATTESGDTALTLTSGTTSLEGMTIRAGLMGNSSLTTGDSVTLVNNGNGLANNSTKYEKLSEGVSLDYDLTFTNTDNKIDMLIGNPITTSTGNALKPQTAAIEQAAAVPAVRLMNSVVDLGNNWLQPENFEQENKDVANQQVELTNEFRMFGSMGASNIRTKTEAGGYVDNKNWGMDLGWAKEVDYNGSKLFFAPIVDYGRAKYESNIGGIKGSGSTNYLAGGMILRKMYDSGFYVEGSFRYGRVQMDFASNDFEMMGEKVHVSYDATTPCWAGHLHVGKNFKIDRQSSLNIYGLYHHAHQGGMTANLSTGETYTFDAVDSGRLRVGARITRQTKKNQRFYSGLAYQYEFSGSARAHYKDYVTPDTSTSGSSAMLELGWQYQPVKNVSWVADLNVSGSVGKEEGVKAVIKIKKVF